MVYLLCFRIDWNGSSIMSVEWNFLFLIFFFKSNAIRRMCISIGRLESREIGTSRWFIESSSFRSLINSEKINVFMPRDKCQPIGNGLIKFGFFHYKNGFQLNSISTYDPDAVFHCRKITYHQFEWCCRRLYIFCCCFVVATIALSIYNVILLFICILMERKSVITFSH